MANEEQLSILKQGVDVWNKWREEQLEIVIDLSKARLGSSDLSSANFRQANLIRANFQNAILNGVDFSSSDLTGADFIDANLINANLQGADLSMTNFSRAHLAGTDFHQTTLFDTVFANLDLSKAIGLKTAKHLWASTLGTNSLVKSKGNIPDGFLRGCGLSDWEIHVAKLYNPDLSNSEFIDIQNYIFDLRLHQAIQITPLFVSYSHGDRTFVDKMDKYLTDKGIRFWRDIHDLKAGRIERQIDQAISQDRTILLVLSEQSLKSDWVEHEVRKAREIAKNAGRDTLCPIALDDSWKKSPWPARIMEQIMEYNILDFSGWRDDSKFEGMFRRLIDGLELFYKG